MAAIEVSGGGQGHGQKAQAGGGEGNGIPGRPGRERCTDDPNFAVMVAFLQVLFYHVNIKCKFRAAYILHKALLTHLQRSINSENAGN